VAAVEEELQLIFSHYNKTLFGGNLPPCQINICRKAKKPGFFSSERWIDGQKTIIHEINLNPQSCECWELRIPQGIAEEQWPPEYIKKNSGI